MKYTKEERLEKRKERMALLDQAVEQLKSSEAWEAWLKVRRSFHSYSWRNQLMISIQRPDTIAVKGFRQWPKLNRQIKKGATAIWILAPTPFKTGETLEDGTPERKMWFKPVPVFAYEDTEQIEGKPVIDLVPIVRDIEGSDLHPELVRLETWLANHGVRVEFKTLVGATHGYFRPGANEIGVDDKRSINSMFKTLVHETAHWLVHTDETLEASWTYDYEEVVVESVAYAVCATFGLETSGYSAGYVASWHDGQKPNELVECVDTLATRIEEALDGPDRQDPRSGTPGDDQQLPAGDTEVHHGDEHPHRGVRPGNPAVV
jgi:antirestriction protein ArdC